ncbi:MAG: DUF4845 domain-containing protein [Terriglobia bacterium]
MGYRLASERGGSRLKTVVALLITAGIVLALVRIVPVYVKNYEFKDAVREEAKFARVRDETPMQIRQRLFQKAQQVGIHTIRPQQIHVVPAGRGVRISVNYNVPVQLIGYTFTLNFQASADTASVY